MFLLTVLRNYYFLSPDSKICMYVEYYLRTLYRCNPCYDLRYNSRLSVKNFDVSPKKTNVSRSNDSLPYQHLLSSRLPSLTHWSLGVLMCPYVRDFSRKLTLSDHTFPQYRPTTYNGGALAEWESLSALVRSR